MNKFRVGQEVSYRDIFKDKKVTGSIISIVQIIDHVRKEYIGQKVCYISVGEGYCPYEVFIEDLELVEVADE